MIHKAMSQSAMMLAMAAGLVVAGGAPVKADFFKDVERTFVDTFTGAYEDARGGVKDVVKDANQALSGPDQSGRRAATGSAYAPAYASGNLTAEVQSELTAAGYNPGPADGVAGPRTANAVRAYQANNGLAQDGVVSPALLDHLRSKRLSAYSTGAGQPQYQPQHQPQPSHQTQPQLPQRTTATPSGGYVPPGPGPQQSLAPVTVPPAPVVQQAEPRPDLPRLPGAGAQQQAQDCQPYERRMVVEGQETVTKGTACLQPDGTWKPVN
ncbi:MAG: peptidoglycan-binding protein [Alphaproteobacteria bacterium]|nr:peptidoglycan-binding protein [Alphaproteobacteria bacterium]